MACEPAGRGPKLTCLATCSYASLPSKPPVLSAGKASSGICILVFVTTDLLAASALELPFASGAPALQPESDIRNSTPQLTHRFFSRNPFQECLRIAVLTPRFRRVPLLPP